jgi:hypothetical protein
MTCAPPSRPNTHLEDGCSVTPGREQIEENMRYRYFEAFYGFSPTMSHIALSKSARAILNRMAEELLHSGDLIAIYVPIGSDPCYAAAKGLGGRVVGSVRLIPMPPARSEKDYFHEDPVTGQKRWPIGWPCAVVDAPPPERQPLLFDLVHEVYRGKVDFVDYTRSFRSGPFEISREMSAAIARSFLGEITDRPPRRS